MSRGFSIDDATETYDVDPDRLKRIAAFVAATPEQEKPAYAGTLR